MHYVITFVARAFSVPSRSQTTRLVEGRLHGFGCGSNTGLSPSKALHSRRLGPLPQPNVPLQITMRAGAGFVFWLPPSQPPICTGDQPFSRAFQLTSDLRRLPISGRTFPTPLPTLADRQILRLALGSTSNSRWRPSLRPAFQPTFDSRLRPTFQPGLGTDLRLAPPADPSGLPSNSSPACAFDPSSGPTFQLLSSLRLRSTFRSRLRN
jgi:hypothetical protein